MERIKKELLKKAEDIEVSMDDLTSAYWDRNIYGLEPHLAIGDWEYNENEYWGKQLEKLAEFIRIDGLREYATLDEDEDLDGKMTKEYSDWLERLSYDLLKDFY